MYDSLIDQGRRRQMIELLRKRGIDEVILSAMAKIPRHLFIDKSFSSHAYDDKPFSIGAGQTISHPYTVAFQTQLLQLNKYDKVLEVGTGSGYQAAVLAELGANVYSIERHKELYIQSQRVFRKLNYRIHSFWGDGYEGKPTIAPFNKILVTAGAPEIPQKLLLQLSIGGIMVIPLGQDQQDMIVIKRLNEAEFSQTEHGRFQFVPMLSGVVNSSK